MRLLNLALPVLFLCLTGLLLYGQRELTQLRHELRQLQQQAPSKENRVQILGAEWVSENILRFRIWVPPNTSVRLVADTANLHDEIVGQVDSAGEPRHFVAWLAAVDAEDWERLAIFIKEYGLAGKTPQPIPHRFDHSGFLGVHDWHVREELVERDGAGISLVDLVEDRVDLGNIALRLVPVPPESGGR